VQPEPVSPELVLIDPELARRERAKLEERAQLRAIHEAADLRLAFERAAARSSETPPEPAVRGPELAAFVQRRILPAALLCSLLLNGFFAAKLVTRDEAFVSAAAPLPAPVVTSAARAATSTTAVTTAVKRNVVRASSRRPRGVTAKASVERKLVSLMLAAPAGKLPDAFVDSATGLVKNNLQVVCRRRPKSYLCAIRIAGGAQGKGLLVRYREQRGRDVFTWYGYRKVQ
jgi:hypothetical protein